MALKIDSMSISDKSSNTGSKTETAFANRLEALRAKMSDAEIHLTNLGKEGFQSKAILTRFNKSLGAAAHAVERLEKDLKDTHSRIFAAGTVPSGLRKSLEKYKNLGSAITELVKVSNEIEKSISKLRTSGAGSKAYTTAFQNLSGAIARGGDVLPKGQRTEIGKQVAAVFRSVLKDASGELKGVGVSNIARGIGAAGGMPTFAMGASTASAFDSKFAKDQLRDARSFSQQASSFSRRGPGIYEAMYEREFPSPRFGKKTFYNKNLVPASVGGGGGGGGSGGLPMFTGGGLPALTGGVPAIRQNWTRGSSGPFRSRYEQPISDAELVGGGGGLGAFALGGLGGLAAGEIASRALKYVPSFYHFLEKGAQPGYEELERIAKAGRIVGQGPDDMRKGLTNRGRMLTVSNAMSRLGYGSMGDVADVFSSYGSPYRAIPTFTAATGLAQGKYTGFQDSKAWAGYYQGLQGMGIGAGAGGLDANTKAIEDSIRIGVERGMPPQKTFENMEAYLRIVASTSTVRSPGDVTKFMSIAASSALPGVRDLSSLGSQQSVFKNTLANPLSDPLYFASLMSETKRITGSFTPNAAGIQKVLDARGGGLKLDAKTRRAINLNKTNPAIVWGLIGHEGTKPEFTQNIRWQTQYQAFKGLGMSDADAKIQADMFSIFTTPGGAAEQTLAGKNYGPKVASKGYTMKDFDAILGYGAAIKGVNILPPRGAALKGGSRMFGEGGVGGLSLPGISRTSARGLGYVEPTGLEGSMLEKSRMMGAATFSVELEKAGGIILDFGGKMTTVAHDVDSFIGALTKATKWLLNLTGGTSMPGTGAAPAVPPALSGHGGRGAGAAP